MKPEILKTYLLLGSCFCLPFMVKAKIMTFSLKSDRIDFPLAQEKDKVENVGQATNREKHIVDITISRQSTIIDDDQDGMDDDWEIANGLDPNDSRDAWRDTDGDRVLNLYEFILDANPQSNASPLFINILPGQDLELLIKSAPNGVVIRVSEGVYDLNHTHVSRLIGSFSLMIQGGWNSDYTVYDPCRYRTIISPSSSTDILKIINEEAPVNLIIDGLEIQTTQKMYGIFAIHLKNTTGNTVVSNCTITNDTIAGGGVELFVRGKSQANCWIVNSLIANNTGTGVDITVTDSSTVTLNVLHATIYNNEDTASVIYGGGIEAGILRAGQFTLNVENSIIYENEALDLDLSGFSGGTTAANVRNSIIGVNDFSGMVDYTEMGEISTAYPDFVDVSNNDFRLNENSAAINMGMDLGLPFGSMPNAGWNACADLISNLTVIPSSVNDFNVFPNPARQSVTLTLDLKRSEQVQVYLVNSMGQKVLAFPPSIFPEGLYQHHYTFSNLPSGLYTLQGFFTSGILTQKLIIL